MENTKELKKAVAVGLLAELSIRRKLRQLKRRYRSRQNRKDILRNLRGKRKRPHRLHPDWRDVAVDGWDSMVI